MPETADGQHSTVGIAISGFSGSARHYERRQPNGARVDQTGNGGIRITVPRASDVSCDIEVYSAQGKIVHASRSIRFGTTKTVAPAMPNGIYFVRLASGAIRKTLRIAVYR